MVVRCCFFVSVLLCFCPGFVSKFYVFLSPVLCVCVLLFLLLVLIFFCVLLLVLCYFHFCGVGLVESYVVVLMFFWAAFSVYFFV